MSAEATGWVWRHSQWNGQHVKFLLHLAVADVVNDVHDNRFWMSQAALADKVGCARGTVNEWLREAVECGALEVVQHNDQAGKPNVYRFVFSLEGGVSTDDRGCQPGVQGGVSTGDTKHKSELNRTQEDAVSAVAGRVLTAWVQATGRDPARVKMNSKRLGAVKARLNEGYTEDDLTAAVQGIALSAWHMGDNPDRKRFDDFLVAIRDGERVERFRDLHVAGGDGGGDRGGSAVAEALRRRAEQ